MLGFHEKGGNGDPFSTFFHRGPEAWCADFVSYCYSKAGDIVMFDWSSGGPTAQHTGLVEKVFKQNGRLSVQTIEGNSSNQVMRHTYPVSSSVIAGFGTMP